MGFLDFIAFLIFLVLLAIVSVFAPLMYLWFALTSDRMIDGVVALYTVYVYCGLSVVATIVLFVRPTVDGLPVGWKLFSMAYLARQKSYVNSANFDAGKFTAGSQPSTLYGKRMMTNVYTEINTLLKRRSSRIDDATNDYLKAEKARADAAVEMAKAKTAEKIVRDWEEKESRE